MDALKNILSPLAVGSGAIQDTLKLVVIGGTVETARRASVSAWNGFVDSFFLTAHFSQEDYPYDWLMHWLSKQPAWGRSREFEITTRSAGRGGMTQTSGDIEDEGDDDGDQLVHGRRKRRVAFIPSIGKYNPHNLLPWALAAREKWTPNYQKFTDINSEQITRTKSYPEYGHGCSLKISVVARNNDILKKLVLEAKKEYEKDTEHRVHIFMADMTYSCWRWNGARQKRPMSSIVLQPGVKDMLLADCKDFLNSEEWYAERGIPFRRGYLLHGVPGSGKTSLIHSLAGELGLDIYVLSLSAKGMSDNTLASLMGNVPSRCIVLLEDLDAAFTRGVSRDSSSTGVPTTTSSSSSSSSSKDNADKDDGSTLSLSGLLNSLDGVAAAEGRLLFATTNHIERLDPALSRPGRMDVWVNFTHATKWQAEGIFKCFFPCKKTATTPESESDISQQNMPVPRRKNQKISVPLLSEEEISDLAKKFAAAIPEGELSVASLQGYLLKNKTRPYECVEEVAEWVIQERETRENIKKEKEKAEREAREKQEAAEKEKKEKEEKEKKEKDEKEAKERIERKEARAKAKRVTNARSETPSETTESTAETSSPSSSSSSESDEGTGNDADSEESITSEEEPEKTSPKGSVNGSDQEAQGKKDKWVAVKVQATEENAAT